MYVVRIYGYPVQDGQLLLEEHEFIDGHVTDARLCAVHAERDGAIVTFTHEDR